MTGNSEVTTTQKAPRHRAERLLVDALLTGPRAAAEIRELSTAAGFAWRTVQDAASRLGVVRSKTGMGGGWIWELPDKVREGAMAAAHADAGPPVTCLAAYGFAVPEGPPGLMYATPVVD